MQDKYDERIGCRSQTRMHDIQKYFRLNHPAAVERQYGDRVERAHCIFVRGSIGGQTCEQKHAA